MKQPTNSTLYRWRKEVLAGKASHETKVKLVRYVRDCILPPSKLMDAYLVAATDVGTQEENNG